MSSAVRGAGSSGWEMSGAEMSGFDSSGADWPGSGWELPGAEEEAPGAEEEALPPELAQVSYHPSFFEEVLSPELAAGLGPQAVSARHRARRRRYFACFILDSFRC